MTQPTLLPTDLAHSHYVELVEHHEISVELPAMPGDFHRAAILSDTRAAALDWLEHEGLGGTVVALERQSPPTVGCVFDVVVAKAVASPTGSEHKWRWSARWRDWLHRFAAMRRAEMHAPRHPIRSEMLAEVVPMRPSDGPLMPAPLPTHCPGSDDPRCRSLCTVDSRTNRIKDPDCFRTNGRSCACGATQIADGFTNCPHCGAPLESEKL